MERSKDPNEMAKSLLDQAEKGLVANRNHLSGSFKTPQSPLQKAFSSGRLCMNKGDNGVLDLEDEFKISIVVWETIYNLFYPFTFPLIYYREGWVGLHNRMFLPETGVMSVFQFIMGVFFFTLNILFFVRGSNVVCFSEILLIDVYMVIRCLVIGVKYAIYGRKKLKKKRTKKLSKEEIQQELLLGGWLNLPEKLIDKELKRAFYARKLSEAECTVLLPPDDAATFQDCMKAPYQTEQPPSQSSDDGHDTDDDSLDFSDPTTGDTEESDLKEKKVPVLLRDVIKLFILYSNDDVKSHPYLKARVFLGIIHASIPIIGHVISGKCVYGDGSFPEVLLLFLSFILTYFLWSNNFSFLLISYFDGMRRLRTMTLYGILAQTRCRARTPDYFRCNLPRLSLKQPANIVNWLSGRGVVQVFGRTFLKRIEISIALYFLGLLGLLTFLIVFSIEESVELTMMMLFTYDFMILGVALFYVMEIYRSVNNQVKAHQTVVIYEQFRIRESIVEARYNIDTLQRYRNCDQLLDSVRLILENDEERFAVRFLGLSVSRGWSNVMLSFLLSGASVGLKIILDL